MSSVADGESQAQTPTQTEALFNSLRFRLLAMLSLALLPIGLIAVNQTKQVGDAQRQNAELVLLTRTEQASFDERVVIEQARGAARMLGALQAQLADDAVCTEYLRAFVAANARFSFVGVLPISGQMVCSSAGRSFDFSDFEDFDASMREGSSRVTINQEAPLSGKSVIVVSEPYYESGQFRGMISVSVPHARLEPIKEGSDFPGLTNVITFNAQGVILTSGGDINAAYLDTPSAMTLDQLTGQGGFSFSARDKLNEDRIFSVVPIIEDTVYTLGVWDPDADSVEPFLGQLPIWLFPVLMWIASLAVALFAIHRLVIRHVRALGRNMKGFAKDRRLPATQSTLSPPAELAEMEDDFFEMAVTILRDEAKLEDNLRDKNVLLKEVHHRVKNNLQLISSIMSMQSRKALHAETRDVLARLQDRVLSLATIHRDLYQSQRGGRVNAGRLVEEIVEKSVEIGEETQSSVIRTIDVDTVLLYPDQAVPLSLLVAEASTNAMKYLGPDKTGQRWITLSLKVDDDQNCTFVFENSMAGATDAESTGLGAQLISAFTMQLGGQMDAEQMDDRYRMVLTFPITEFSEGANDY
ncbi:MAG: sensor histidine kinase [Pseudomonadota bacterium]